MNVPDFMVSFVFIFKYITDEFSSKKYKDSKMNFSMLRFPPYIGINQLQDKEEMN